MRDSRSSRRAARAAALIGFLACAAASAAAQEEPRVRSTLERAHVDAVRTLYAQPTWAVGAVRSGLANDVALRGWAAGALSSEQGLLTRSYRSTADETAPPSFVLETCVEDTPAAAHERLLGWLAGLQSTRKMPSATEAGLTVGDAGFVGRSGAGPRALAWVAFVRGNVAVRVSAFDARSEPELELGALAAEIDAAIVAAPALEGGRVPAKPVIAQLRAERASVVAGTPLALEVELVDPARGEAHVQWVVGGPGQGYVEKDASGKWRFHPTAPGRVTLALEVTGSTGTWSRREIAFDVLDD